MKSLFLTVTFVLTYVFSYAQAPKHLTFKGIPIDGKLNDYVLKMKENGFKHIGTEDGTAILNGEFAGFKYCNVVITALKQKDLVYKVGVLFPSLDTWSRLSGNYFELKQMLTEKYGKPSEIEERFDGSVQPNDDNLRIMKVKYDQCKYYSIWKTDKGEIQLSIDHIDTDNCFVKLNYFDKINGAIINSKAIDDL